MEISLKIDHLNDGSQKTTTFFNGKIAKTAWLAPDFVCRVAVKLCTCGQKFKGMSRLNSVEIKPGQTCVVYCPSCNNNIL